MGADTVVLTSEGHAQKLQAELTQLRDRHALCDLTVQVSGGIEYPVHKVVLVAHSRYFRLQMDCGQLQGHTHIISSVDSAMFAPLLTYLYTGQLHITSTNIWAIITAATLLDIPDALSLCEDFLQSSMADKGEGKMLIKAIDASTTVVKGDAESDMLSYASEDYDESTRDLEKDSLYKMAPRLKQHKSGDYDHLRLKITKKELPVAEPPCENVPMSVRLSGVANPDTHMQAEKEMSRRLLNEELKEENVSRKMRKQPNPQQMVSPLKVGRSRESAEMKHPERVPIITHRKWIVMKKDQLHQCQNCKRCFAYRAMLFLHKKQHKFLTNLSRRIHPTHSNNFEPVANDIGFDYKCKLCHDSQKLCTLAYAHQCKYHMSQRPFSCNYCQRAYTSSSALFLHTVQKHDAPSHTATSLLYRCSKCPRTFYYKTTFIKHIRAAHSPGRKCANCSHYNKPTHAHEKHLLACYCIQSTAMCPNQVTPVIGTETHEMRCGSCDRLFKYQKAYSKHLETCKLMKDSGSIKQQHKCLMCKDHFSTAKLLREHCATTHGKARLKKKALQRSCAKRWDCEVDHCGFKSFSPKALTKHAKQFHPAYALACQACHFTASSNVLLERHLQRRHVRGLRCGVCQRTFSVAAQLRVHMYSKHQVNDGSVQVTL